MAYDVGELDHREDNPPVFDAAEPGAYAGVSSPSHDSGATPALPPASPRELTPLQRPTRHAIFPGAGAGAGAGARGMVLGWCLWLLGTWSVMLPAQGPVWAVRGMIVAAVVGLMTLWPMVRLSQGPGPQRAEAAPPPGVEHGWVALGVLGEWLSLIAVFQAVVWPLRVTGNWGLEQTLWLDAAVASWSLLAAAILTMGLRTTRSLGRCLAMALCIALLLGEGLWIALLPAAEARISPLPIIWSLTVPELHWQRQPAATSIILAAIAAVLAWAVVLATLPRRPKTSQVALRE